MSKKTTTRDELAESLRNGYRNIILEADEWRPLADHILALMDLAHRGKFAIIKDKSGKVTEIVDLGN